MLFRISITLYILSFSSIASALRANKVWMEFRPNGRYRVYINYTLPEVKEYREVWVEYAKKKEAERYYFDLVRGAEFYLPDAKLRKFVQNPLKPDPW